MKNIEKILLLLLFSGFGPVWAGHFTSIDESFDSIQQTALKIVEAFLEDTDEGMSTAWDEMETVGKNEQLRFLEGKRAIGRVARTLSGEFTAIGSDMTKPGLLDGKKVVGFRAYMLASAEKDAMIDQVLESIDVEPIYQATFLVLLHNTADAPDEDNDKVQELMLLLLFDEVDGEINLAAVIFTDNNVWELMTLVPAEDE